MERRSRCISNKEDRIMNGTASNRNCVTKDLVMSVTDAVILR